MIFGWNHGLSSGLGGRSIMLFDGELSFITSNTGCGTETGITGACWDVMGGGGGGTTKAGAGKGTGVVFSGFRAASGPASPANFFFIFSFISFMYSFGSITFAGDAAGSGNFAGAAGDVCCIKGGAGGGAVFFSVILSLRFFI